MFSELDGQLITKLLLYDLRKIVGDVWVANDSYDAWHVLSRLRDPGTKPDQAP